jgi:hypothetical protein
MGIGMHVISSVAGVAACLLTWTLFYGVVLPETNFGVHLVAGGAGIAIGIIVRFVLRQLLLERYQQKRRL